MWEAMEDFRQALHPLNTDQWGRILGSLRPQDNQQYDNQVDIDDLEIFSAYCGGLVDFASPLKGGNELD
jgi:hypothetical protein